MLTALGMVFMVIGGLLLLSAGGEAWQRLVAAMLVAGVALLAAGYLLAF